MKTFRVTLNRTAEIAVQAELDVEASDIQAAVEFAKGAVVKDDWFAADVETTDEWTEARELRAGEEDYDL